MPTDEGISVEETPERLRPGSVATAAKALKTDRLELEWLTSDDAGLMLAIWNDPTFIRFVGDRGVRSVDDARAALESGAMAMYEKYGYGPYRILLRASHEVIGICGLFRRDYLEDPDIGCALLPAYRGRGYAGEAALAVTDYARNGLALPRLTALVSAANAASVGLILKLGMHHERAITVQNEAEPVQLYVVDWQSNPAGNAERDAR